MRYSRLPVTMAAVLGMAALAPPVAAKDAANPQSIDVRCATGLHAGQTDCTTQTSTDWRQAQFDAARPVQVDRPDAPQVEIDWKAQQELQLQSLPDGLTQTLRLSLNGD